MEKSAISLKRSKVNDTVSIECLYEVHMGFHLVTRLTTLNDYSRSRKLFQGHVLQTARITSAPLRKSLNTLLTSDFRLQVQIQLNLL